MDLMMIIFRLIHIFAGIIWVGAGFFMLLVLVPAVRSMDPNVPSVMGSAVFQKRFNRTMTISALLTTLFGLALYGEVSDGFNADWMSSDGGIVLSIGSLAGLLAFGHGAGALGPLTNKIARLGEALREQDGPPTAEQRAELQALQAKNVRHAQISMVLLVIAVAGMAAARYM